jgi:hypothetical protein
MRTKQQLISERRLKMTRIVEILTHSRDTILSDAAGVLGLAVFTYGLLYLPGLF